MFYRQEKAGGQALPPLPPNTDLGRARLFPGRVRSSSTELPSAGSAGLTAEHPARAKHCAQSLFPAKQRRCWDYPGSLHWLLGDDDFDLLWPSFPSETFSFRGSRNVARLNPHPYILCSGFLLLVLPLRLTIATSCIMWSSPTGLPLTF